jgi:hypothetical protein
MSTLIEHKCSLRWKTDEDTHWHECGNGIHGGDHHCTHCGVAGPNVELKLVVHDLGLNPELVAAVRERIAKGSPEWIRP